MEQVEAADRYRICEWYRFLEVKNDEQITIMNRICERLKELGGFTPEISKSLGW
jgi:hypothetical protein